MTWGSTLWLSSLHGGFKCLKMSRVRNMGSPKLRSINCIIYLLFSVSIYLFKVHNNIRLYYWHIDWLCDGWRLEGTAVRSLSIVCILSSLNDQLFMEELGLVTVVRWRHNETAVCTLKYFGCGVVARIPPFPFWARIATDDKRLKKT